MQKALTKALFVLGCVVAASVPAVDSGLLVYQVREAGVGPYFSRILVNDDHVRLDEGLDAGDFTLFDRNQEIIYAVSHEEQSVMVINPGPVDIQANDALILNQTEQVDREAPTIAGEAPHNVKLLANGEVCNRLVVVPGLMEDALEGIRELKRVLARVHAATLAGTPPEMQTPCDLAANVHAPTRSLDQGLPIQENSGSVNQTLVDFVEQHPSAEALFELPAGYARTGMPGL